MVKMRYIAILFLFGISTVLLHGKVVNERCQYPREKPWTQAAMATYSAAEPRGILTFRSLHSLGNRTNKLSRSTHSFENKEIQNMNHTLNLNEYILLTLKASTTGLQKAENEIKNAEADYIYAQQSNKSTFNIEKALIYLEKMRSYKIEIKSEIIIKAVSLYFSLLQAERNLLEKEKQLAINSKEEKTAKLRFAEGVKEEAEYAEKKEITLESRIALIKAKDAYIKAYRKFLQGTGTEYAGNDQIFPEKKVPSIPLKKMEFKECLNKAEIINPSCMFNLKMYELYKSYNDEIIHSAAATEKEKNYSKTQMASYNINYKESKSSLENTIWSLVTENNIALDILKLKKTQTEIAEKQLEIKRIEYSNGTIFKAEVSQTELNYKESQNDLKTEMENIFLNYIQLKSVTGENIQQLCTKFSLSILNPFTGS